MYNLEKERLFTLDTEKHLSCRRLRIIAESYAIKGLYFASFYFFYLPCVSVFHFFYFSLTIH